MVELFRNNFDEIYATIDNLNERKMENTGYQKDLFTIKRDISNQKMLNEDFEYNLTLLDDFIVKHLSVGVTNEVSEALMKVVGSKETFGKIRAYQKQKRAAFAKVFRGEEESKESESEGSNKEEPKDLEWNQVHMNQSEAKQESKASK
mmetsp:Transcript_22089/g.21289  ORF Transcript_22089/g.21289 Transcript_22089/m.21289 type:complete len:148 (-) Transcript_22089:656-1099(-)|eukprot:CAMPEP_0170551160 /NCGR_PEP_ID=MMETSP0211-20121228/9188_1 /TAXON_ID=311385 /ORGANISM="Pseudokeronopsis sp., Strain OXSARD2" /LENGTH=147 /DNA_ID=CAMNT_0010858159 /DNA_START=457 /DNA_END=900 /DNA_ORIENTATION=+